MANHRLVERYVLRSIFPYILASLLLLTATLFAQQTGRYFETIFPSVCVFTIPMSVLSGTIIGLARMSSDSELVALSAAGMNKWKILWPALALGLIATIGTFVLNMSEVPRAQQQLRSVALRSALYK